MSSLVVSKKKHCPLFLSGEWCLEQAQCRFIHDKSVLNAAIKKNQLEEYQTSYGGPSVTRFVQKLNNIEAGILPGKNRFMTGRQHERWIQDLNMGNFDDISTIRKKDHKMGKETQISRAGASRGYSGGGQISEIVDHVSATISANNTSRTAQHALSFYLNRALPNLSFIHQPGVPRLPGFGLIPDAELFFDNQRDLSTIIFTRLATYVNSGSKMYRLNHRSNRGDDDVDGFSRKAVEKIEIPNYWGPAAFSMQHYGIVAQLPSPSNIADRKPLRKFTLFPELPFEIRLVVWQMAIRFPYNPTVQLLPIRDDTGSIVFRDLVCQSLTPIVLRINHESRKEALKHFTLTLSNSTYLNKDTGTLFFKGDSPGDLVHFVASAQPQELRNIKNMAVNLCEWIWEESFKEAMWAFTDIERLVMMFSKSDDNYYLRKEATKLIRKELTQPPETSSGWKVPSIVLVPSKSVENFLNKHTFE